MQNSNNFITNTIKTFRYAVTNRSLRDHIPGENYAQLALDIKDCLKQIIDHSTIERIMSLFRDVLYQFGDDIPNDDKTDILYIVENHIKTFQAGQYIMWTFKWLMICKNQDWRLTDNDYDRIQDYAVFQLETEMDCCGNLDTVVTHIIREFDDMLKSKNISLAQPGDPAPANPSYIIYGETYAKLRKDIFTWVSNIL